MPLVAKGRLTLRQIFLHGQAGGQTNAPYSNQNAPYSNQTPPIATTPTQQTPPIASPHTPKQTPPVATKLPL